MENQDTVFFLINLKMIMKHGLLHLKNRSQLNIMLGVHNSHFVIENLLREKAKDHEFKASLSEIGFEKIIKQVNKKHNIPFFEDLLRLNTTRNNIQHKNIYPHFDTATDLVQIAEKFLKWGFKMYFDKDYDSLKLEDMIYDAPIKRVMLISKNAINNNDLKLASEKMYEGLGALKFMWFGYLSDWRVSDQIYSGNLDMPNLLADLAFKIILSEDQHTLKKLLQIGSRWVLEEGQRKIVSNYEFIKFKDKEEALEHYDSILNIILNYQDKIPNWRRE